MFQWAQIQSGIGEPVLTYSKPIPYLESQWLCHLREGLWQISGHIYIPELWMEPLQRHNDSFLMSHLLHDQSLSYTQLHSLNCCRLYLKISRISDIASTGGKSIQQCYRDGTAQNPYTTLQWPIQLKPHTSAWKLWSKTLNRHFPIGSTLHPQLGQWCHSSNKYK